MLSPQEEKLARAELESGGGYSPGSASSMGSVSPSSYGSGSGSDDDYSYSGDSSNSDEEVGSGDIGDRTERSGRATKRARPISWEGGARQSLYDSRGGDGGMFDAPPESMERMEKHRLLSKLFQLKQCHPDIKIPLTVSQDTDVVELGAIVSAAEDQLHKQQWIEEQWNYMCLGVTAIGTACSAFRLVRMEGFDVYFRAFAKNKMYSILDRLYDSMSEHRRVAPRVTIVMSVLMMVASFWRQSGMNREAIVQQASARLEREELCAMGVPVSQTERIVRRNRLRMRDSDQPEAVHERLIKTFVESAPETGQLAADKGLPREQAPSPSQEDNDNTPTDTQPDVSAFRPVRPPPPDVDVATPTESSPPTSIPTGTIDLSEVALNHFGTLNDGAAIPAGTRATTGEGGNSETISRLLRGRRRRRAGT